MPHHLRATEWCQYREGVTVGTDDAFAVGSSVYTGFPRNVHISAEVPPNTRITLQFASADAPTDLSMADLTAKPVAPSVPREEGGYYWGYEVRSAASLSAVFTECSYDGGYDVTIGTSERGAPMSTVRDTLPDFRHMLVVFGGVAGLEPAVVADPELSAMGVEKPESLFDHWINLCPGQGSRTIRTEEAVWLGLMGLRDMVVSKGASK